MIFMCLIFIVNKFFTSAFGQITRDVNVGDEIGQFQSLNSLLNLVIWLV